MEFIELILAFSADGMLLVVIATTAVVLLASVRKSFWTDAPVFVMAGLTSLLTAKIASIIYQPESVRPFEKLGVDAGASYINNPGFPSDHVLLATVCAIAVYVATKNKALGIVMISAAVLIGLARVAALVHTPLDIFGGFIAGIAGAIWYRLLTNKRP